MRCTIIIILIMIIMIIMIIIIIIIVIIIIMQKRGRGHVLFSTITLVEMGIQL